MEDPSGSGGWRFAQCFGDKGEVEDITEGLSSFYLDRTGPQVLESSSDAYSGLIEQLISYPPSNSTRQEIILPQEIREGVSFCLSATNRSVIASVSSATCSFYHVLPLHFTIRYIP